MSRRQKIIAKGEALLLIDTVGKKIDPLVTALAEFKTFKQEELLELDDQIAAKAIEVGARKKVFDEELEKGKWKKVEDFVEGSGRVLITQETLDDNTAKYKKLSHKFDKLTASIDKEVSSKLDSERKLQALEHQCQMKALEAQNNTYTSEILNLQKSITRMESELKDQKDLTGRFAVSRVDKQNN